MTSNSVNASSNRYHPYAQKMTSMHSTSTYKPAVVPKRPNTGLSDITNMSITSYEKQYYLNAAAKNTGEQNPATSTVAQRKTTSTSMASMGSKTPTKPPLPTWKKTTTKKAATTAAQREAANLSRKLDALNGEAKHLKIFTCTIKNMMYLEHEKFNAQPTPSASSANKSGKILPLVGERMYEFLAQLDSAITEGDTTGARCFALKDSKGRVNCIFNEIDVQMDKLARNSWIRLERP